MVQSMRKLKITLCVFILVCCAEKRKITESVIDKNDSKKSYPESCFNADQMIEFDNMLKKDQTLRQMVSKGGFSKSRLDSIWKLQNVLDKENTEKLIEITETCGFPYPDRINAPIPLWLIFQHADTRLYGQKIKTLLNKELELGNIGLGEFNMIMWHVNGRKLEEFPGNHG